MKISLNWLGDFIDITEKDNEKIKEIITANSAEVETMESVADSFGNVVIGELKKIEKHPDADKLSITQVDIGKEKPIQVIFGKLAKMEVGSRVPVAVAPTRLQTGHIIEKAKLRGVTSEGMLCLDRELGLVEEGDSIHRFTKETPLGTPFVKILGLDDIVLDVDNHAITNRSDLFSHRGFAREFVANGLAKWKKSEKEWKIPEINTPPPIEVNIADNSTCSRYCGVYITGIEIGESPDWMQKRLSACGIRPISNIVDITNYVMLESGMPLHAFDKEQLTGKKHVMRLSKKGEEIVTLDQVKRILPDNVVVLADEKEIYDLCGIMGGYQSEIKSSTNKIWLHAPVFNSALVRRASQALNHRSEASNIYEKGVDDEIAMKALVHATKLILKICPNAKVASKVMDIRNVPQEKRELNLSFSQINRLVGTDIEPKKVEKILTDLGFEHSKSKDGYKVSIPSWRLNDVHREADMIEEIARIYGYDNIPEVTPVMDISPVSTNYKLEFEKKAKERLVARGFDEIYTFAFSGPELLAKCSMEKDAESIEVTNPISSDMSLMCQSLVPRMLETIADNLRYKNTFRLFELNRTYHKKGDKHEEHSSLIAATVGEDFRVLQGMIDIADVIPFNGQPAPHMHPGRIGEVVFRGKSVGRIYEVHPQILKNFGIKTNVTVLEMNVEEIHGMNIDTRPKYSEIPKFPSVQLDISISIPKKNFASDYFKTIHATDKKIITTVELIDEYAGDKISSDKRALTYSITYQAPDRTLTEEEVGAVHKQVISRLQAKGAEIR
ncbi:phenylalanine--tRNA ligase subunit beta [Patescibacteria group bacterium]|nr:phenylalanine--tRNA ligase subunit beta [Patescibacteria group bacterium]MBU1683368.1 phenylalanine--tRNA ligase subunit beta [Patescibacteria group bacterium]MBU1934674.1 phenylalanine--tRNA ligase subunit beta [Patescibacteria group bacterium]